MNDKSKAVYPVNQNVKPKKRIEREDPSKRSKDSDTIIDDALRKFTENDDDSDVYLEKVNNQ